MTILKNPLPLRGLAFSFQIRLMESWISLNTLVAPNNKVTIPTIVANRLSGEYDPIMGANRGCVKGEGIPVRDLVLTRVSVRLLGRERLAQFLRTHAGTKEADILKAWISELTNRVWAEPAVLCRDFHHVDISAPPVVIFRLAGAPLEIETMVHFKSGLVLVKGVHAVHQPLS